MTKLRRRRLRKSFAFKCFVAVLVLLAFLFYFDMQVQKTVSTIVSYQIKVYTTKAINNAVLREIESQDIHYEDLVQLNMGENNQVSSIETDALAISSLKSRISNAVEEELEKDEYRSIGIPVGTLSGSKWLSGFGPEINFRIIPQGSAHTQLESKFDSAGINQTRHQMMLDVQVEFTAVIPGFSTEFTAGTNFCIAETVIVGPIPDAYTNVEDGGNANMSDINDYDANDARIKKYVDDISE